MKTAKKRKCGSCGGYCGGRRGSCKFAANEMKRLADELWAVCKAAHSTPSPDMQAKSEGGRHD